MNFQRSVAVFLSWAQWPHFLDPHIAFFLLFFLSAEKLLGELFHIDAMRSSISESLPALKFLHFASFFNNPITWHKTIALKPLALCALKTPMLRCTLAPSTAQQRLSSRWIPAYLRPSLPLLFPSGLRKDGCWASWMPSRL